MKNSLKKYAIVSILFNIVLLSIYGYYLHQKAAFSGEGTIIPTIEIVNETIAERNGTYREHYLYVLRRKPILQKAFSKVFENNKNIVYDFRQVKDSLLTVNRQLTTKEIDIAFKAYHKALADIKICYDTTFHNIKEAAKFPDEEVEEQIKNFNTNAFESLSISEKELQHLSLEQKKAILFFMENHVTLARIYSDNRFSSMVSYRYGFDGRKITYPIVFPKYSNEISLGKSFQADINISAFFDAYLKRKTPFSIYLNNEKINMDEDKHPFKLNTDSLGKQRVEAVVHWTHPDTKETGQDNTYIEYTVTP